MKKLARRLSKAWQLKVIQVIGQEFIAMTDSDENVLIHVAMLRGNQIQLTMRADEEQDIQTFKKRQEIK